MPYKKGRDFRLNYIETMVESEVKFKGRIVTVRSDKARLHNGKIVSREVVEHPGGVGIVPVDKDGNVIMVKQYRYPIGKTIIEIPAGKLEYGEDPFECAVRELKEETGCKAEKLVSLGEMLPSPGYCKETLYTYLALNLIEGDMRLDEDEFLDVERIPLEKLVDMVMSGEITDGKTIVGILKADKYLKDNK